MTDPYERHLSLAQDRHDARHDDEVEHDDSDAEYERRRDELLERAEQEIALAEHVAAFERQILDAAGGVR